MPSHTRDVALCFVSGVPIACPVASPKSVPPEINRAALTHTVSSHTSSTGHFLLGHLCGQEMPRTLAIPASVLAPSPKGEDQRRTPKTDSAIRSRLADSGSVRQLQSNEREACTLLRTGVRRNCDIDWPKLRIVRRQRGTKMNRVLCRVDR